MTQLAPKGSATIDIRQRASAQAAHSLIEDSCFLSPEGKKHGLCIQSAAELLGVLYGYQDLTSDDWRNLIAQSETFAFEFFCRGHNTSKGNVPVLAAEEWEHRLVDRGLEIAIATAQATDGLMMYTIHRTARLYAERNYLNHSEGMDARLRIKHIRSSILDAWPEGEKPEHDTWEVRWIRESVTFWTLAYPYLGKIDDDTIEAFNTRYIRAIAGSAMRWYQSESDMQQYGDIVANIMNMEGVDKVAAIAAISPLSQKEKKEEKKAYTIHPPELIRRGEIVETASGLTMLVIKLEENEPDLLQIGYGVLGIEHDDFLSMFVSEGDIQPDDDIYSEE